MRNVDQRFSAENIADLLLRTLQLRDREAAGHSHRVAPVAILLGQAVELKEHEVALLRRAALLHDIGKLGIPDSILLKPGALGEDEKNIMKRHAGYGAELVLSIPSLQPAAPIIKHHHEKWDGSGYPDKLKGKDIPSLARICSVAEVFDALTSEQVYRRAWPKDQVLQLMQQESERAFDPAIVAGLIKLMQS